MTDELVFPRDLEPVDYLMFRSDGDPRARSGMLSMAMLDVAPDFERLQAVFERASRVSLRLRQHVVVPVLPHHRRAVGHRSRLRPRLPRPKDSTSRARHAAPAARLRPADVVGAVRHCPAAVGDLPRRGHHRGRGSRRAADEDAPRCHRRCRRGRADRASSTTSIATPTAARCRPCPRPRTCLGTDLTRRAARRAPISAVSGRCVHRLPGRSPRWPDGERPGHRAQRHHQDGRLGAARARPASRAAVARCCAGAAWVGGSRCWSSRSTASGGPAKSAGGSVNDAYIGAIWGRLRRYHEALGVMRRRGAVGDAGQPPQATTTRPAGTGSPGRASPHRWPSPIRRARITAGPRERAQRGRRAGDQRAQRRGAGAQSPARLRCSGCCRGSPTTTDVQASNVPGSRARLHRRCDGDQVVSASDRCRACR